MNILSYPIYMPTHRLYPAVASFELTSFVFSICFNSQGQAKVNLQVLSLVRILPLRCPDSLQKNCLGYLMQRICPLHKSFQKRRVPPIPTLPAAILLKVVTLLITSFHLGYLAIFFFVMSEEQYVVLQANDNLDVSQINKSKVTSAYH